MRKSRITGLLGGATLLAALTGAAGAVGLPTDKSITFQESATPQMDMVTNLHTIAFVIITAIVILVMGLMLFIFIRFNEKANPVPSKTSHNTLLEVVWTAAPVMIVLFLIAVATRPLYYLDTIPEPDMTVKAVGNQWNWDYVYPDHGGFEFNSAPLTKEEAAAKNLPGLLAVTEPMVVPAGKKIRVIVTASDVLHAFAVPAFGVKIDAVPGRLNETWFEVREPGTYYGQCSEVCGQLHYNMPIEVRVLPQAEFDAWVLEKNPEYVKNEGITTEARNTQTGE